MPGAVSNTRSPRISITMADTESTDLTLRFWGRSRKRKGKGGGVPTERTNLCVVESPMPTCGAILSRNETAASAFVALAVSGNIGSIIADEPQLFARIAQLSANHAHNLLLRLRSIKTRKSIVLKTQKVCFSCAICRNCVHIPVEHDIDNVCVCVCV